MTLPNRLVLGGWLADRDGVGYYRIKAPFDALGRRGHAVGYTHDLRWRPGRRPANHVLVAQRVSNPGPSARWAEAAGQVRRVLEIDDDILNIDPSSPAARAYYADPGIRTRLVGNVRSADVITTSTGYLAQVLRADYGATAPIHVLPNCLTHEVLDLPPVDQAGPVTVGWYGGPTHRGDFEQLRRPVGRWLAAHRGVPLVMGGVDYGDLLGREAVVRPWRSIWADAAGYMAGIDVSIGLAPLANTQFNRCKSDLKALEYAARGIPVVASDVEPYRGFVEHGVTGFLVTHPREWAEALDALATDPGLRARMGAAARAKAATRIVDDHAHLWERAYARG